MVQEKKHKIDFKRVAMAAIGILDLTFLPFFIYGSPRCFLLNFKSVGLSVQKKQKNRSSRWRPSWISDRNNFSYFFYLQVTPMLPTKFHVSWLFGSGEKAQNIFSIDLQDGGHGDHLGFPIGTILAFLFICHVTCALPSFLSIALLVQEKKRKIDVQDSGNGAIGTIFNYFLSTSHPNCFYQISSQLPQGCRRSRVLKQIVGATRRTTRDEHGRRTL